MKRMRFVPGAAALTLLALAVLFGCTKRRTPPTAVTPPPVGSATAVIRMVPNQFLPHDTTVSHGDTVLWVNMGGFHTSTSGACTPCAEDSLWDSGLMSAGDSFRVVFGPGTDVPGEIVHIDASGHFPYFCVPHAFIPMDGSITVNP
jgi:plastocyanin